MHDDLYLKVVKIKLLILLCEIIYKISYSVMSSTSVCLELLGINEVRDYQQQFIELIRQKSDAFIILPTGSGKSLAYQLAPFLTGKRLKFYSSLTALDATYR